MVCSMLSDLRWVFLIELTRLDPVVGKFFYHFPSWLLTV